jgi:ankyrin repeat protein
MPQIKNLIFSIFTGVVLLGCGTTVQERDTATISIHNFDAQMQGGKSEGRKRNATADYQLSKRLINACRKGDLKAAKVLLSNGARVDLRDSDRSSPLHHAVSGRNANLVKYLISLEADVNAETISGVTPLHLATKNGDKEIVELLLKKDANVNAKVATLNYSVTLKTAFSKTPIPDEAKNGKSPLHFAAESGSEEVVRQLLEKGADINYITSDGNGALDYAKNNEHDGIVALLERNNSKSKYERIFKNDMISKIFKRANKKSKYEHLIQDFKYQILNLEDEKYPIYYHISINDKNNVEDIINNDRNQIKKQRVDGGISPLLVALLIGNYDIGELLIANEANVNEEFKDKHTLLHYAVVLEDKDFCKLLVLNGADIDSKNVDGISPKIIANKQGNKEIVEIINYFLK